METNCLNCKISFDAKPCLIKSGRKKYCSKKCKALFTKGIEHIPLKQRFFKRVEKGVYCWLWKGQSLPSGYGLFNTRTVRTRLAHRISYIIHYGKIPKGFLVLHQCDTPSCVKPSHLWLGTQSQNIQDMYEKGRRWVIKKVSTQKTLA